MFKKLSVFAIAMMLVFSIGAVPAYALESWIPCPDCGKDISYEKVHKDGTPLASEELSDARHGSYTEYLDETTCVEYYRYICDSCGYKSDIITIKNNHEFTDTFTICEVTETKHIPPYI